MEARAVLVPVLAATCVVFAIVRLRAGVLLWMALAATTVPIPLVSVRTTHVHFASAYLALLLVLWAARMARRGGWEIAPSRLNLPLLTLAAAAVLASLLGNGFYDPDVEPAYWHLAVQAYATALVVLSAGAALLVGNLVDSVGALRRMYWIVLGAGLVFVVSPFLPAPPYTSEPAWWPLVLAHGLALTYARALCDRSWPVWARVLAVAVVAAAWTRPIVPQLLHPEIDGQWLAGWLAVTLPLVVITFVWSARLTLAALIPAAAAVAYVYGERMIAYAGQVVAQARYEGAAYRIGLWLDAGRLALLRPFFGVGPGNYPDYMNAYGQQWVINTSAHGDYQQVTVEMGFVGLAALVWVLIEALLLGLRLFRSVQAPFPRAFALGALGSVSAMAVTAVVGDYLLPAYHNAGHSSFCTTIYAWMMIGGLMAVESMDRESGVGV